MNKDENKDIEKELVRCEDCGDDFKESSMKETNDGIVCQDCLDDNYSYCDNCDVYYQSDEVHNSTDGDRCDNCLNDFFYCEGCDVYNHIDNRDCECYCTDCCSCSQDSGEDIDGLYRNYSKTTKKFMSKNVGSIIHTKRIFSTEIECYYPDYDSAESVANAMPDELGIMGDGSLDDNGVEFVTPKLQGAKGEKFIIDLCNSLQKNDFTVNKSCGLHIHLDAGRKLVVGKKLKDGSETLDRLKKLFAFYYNFDDILMTFMPKSRRDNHYCYALKHMYRDNEFIIDDVLRCKTLGDFEDLWYREVNKREIAKRKRNKYDDTRYAGVNFHSLLANNNIEIRFHSGTIDSTKILNWIELNCRIMDTIIGGKIELSQITNLNHMSITDKTMYFFNLLKLNKGLVQYYLERQKKFISGCEDTDKICVE